MPQRPIRDVILNQRILTAQSSATVAQAACLMRKSGVGATMVVERGRLVGIFTERDAVFRVLAEGRDVASTTIGEVMTADPQTIDPAKPFVHALHMMYEGGFRHVPVVERGKPVGMVSARDALELDADEFNEALRQREHICAIL
jgi:CBS domain-containing protein